MEAPWWVRDKHSQSVVERLIRGGEDVEKGKGEKGREEKETETEKRTRERQEKSCLPLQRNCGKESRNGHSLSLNGPFAST